MDDAGLSAEGDRALQPLLVKARVGLRLIVAGALVVQGQAVESSRHRLQIRARAGLRGVEPGDGGRDDDDQRDKPGKSSVHRA